MNLYPPNEWHLTDNGLIMPWYVHDSLKWIQENIPKDLTVLEIGGGYSTLWWRENAKEVKTLDSDRKLSEKLNCDYVEPENIGEYLKYEKDYDIVIPDGSGDRAQYILEAFNRCKKYFIVDNWQQPEVCVYPQDVVDFLYNNSKQQLVFKQHNHPYWQTAIFIL